MLWLIITNQLSAQSLLLEDNNARFYFITEMGYLNGIGKVKLDDNQVANQGFGAMLRFIAGHGINQHFAAGLGFGLTGYHDPNSNTFPVFVNLRGYLKEARNTPYASMDLGYAIAITDHFEQGLLANIGIGYKAYLGIFGRRAHLLPGLGFNLQQIKGLRQTVNNQFPPQLEPVADNYLVKSVMISLGVEF